MIYINRRVSVLKKKEIKLKALYGCRDFCLGVSLYGLMSSSDSHVYSLQYVICFCIFTILGMISYTMLKKMFITITVPRLSVLLACCMVGIVYITTYVSMTIISTDNNPMKNIIYIVLFVFSILVFLLNIVLRDVFVSYND